MIGFLHTSPVHVETFDRLTSHTAAGTKATHVVDESLLERARRDGADSVAPDVASRLQQLRDAGAQVIVCTCSTIGDLAERVARDVTTFRVDRPMAREAVVAARKGRRRIGVVAALESTLAPTRRLIEAEAAATPAVSGPDPTIELVLVPDAWPEFEAGHLDAYLQLVADATRELAGRVDVVVLAQASMAAAALSLTDLSVPVLSSPMSAVNYAIAQLE